MTRSTLPLLVLLVALSLLSCRDKHRRADGAGRGDQPGKSPAAARTAAPGDPASRASGASPAGAPASSRAAADPGAAPEKSAAALKEDEAVLAFAGFSEDGQRFAFASRSPTSGPMYFLWTTQPGATSAKLEVSLDPAYRGAFDDARTFIEQGGFTNARLEASAALSLKADLTAKPPTVTLAEGGRAKTSPVDDAPFAPEDTASLWGLSSDRKHAVVRIAGSGGKGWPPEARSRAVISYRVVPAP